MLNRSLKRKPNIVLVGFMGTGKTSVGKRLSSQLRMRYVDTDNVIEMDSRRRISDIFADDGEEVFRRLESKAVNHVSKFYNYVISTGGGVVLKEENITKLKENGVVFCLSATPEEIFNRIGHQQHRPLLQTPDAMETIRSMLADRAPYYAQADYTVETTDKSFAEVMDQIKTTFYKAIAQQKYTKKHNDKDYKRRTQ